MIYYFNKDSVESLLQKRTTRSQAIYITVLLAVAAAAVAVCVVKVPVTVQAQGVVRPITERTEISSTVSEKISMLHISEGQYVAKGDTLMQLSTARLEVAIAKVEAEIQKQRLLIADLKSLLAAISISKLQTTYYKAEVATYNRRLFELQTRLGTVTKSYERNKALYKKDAIASTEMEQSEQEYTSMVSEVELLTSEQRLKWEDELSRYLTSLNEQEGSLKQYQKDLTHYTLSSPTSGTVEQLTGIYQGGYVTAGSTIAVVSPDASIQIECYVQPQDIGYIKLNDTVRIQVSAFPYTEWGMLKARAVSISDDYYLVNNTPMFRVKCTPEKDYLTLSNGFVGKIKKGMVVQARFPVTERTIYQLLFDRVNDWLNPAQQEPLTNVVAIPQTNG